jgi:cobalt-zinc-cadmium resistance protein CzcA
MLASVLALVVTLALAPLLGGEFLPKLDEGNIWLTISLPTSVRWKRPRRGAAGARHHLSYPEVKAMSSRMGRPDDGTDPRAPTTWKSWPT